LLLLDYKKEFIKTLKNEYPLEEVISFFNIVMEHYLGLTRLELALGPNKEISLKERQDFNRVLLRLQRHEPIQYILGEASFFGLKFKVDNNVLIPRPETEDLVSWVLSDLSENDPVTSLNILDIGTGSACIAISLAKNLPQAKLTALDISKPALEMASKNAKLNGVEVQFINEDVLDLNSIPGTFDIIVSNPPYVRDLEKKEMHRNVLENEPSQALYVRDTDALIFYKQITTLAKEALKSGGFLYFEINQYLAEETEQLMKDSGFETIVKKDIFGNFRMIKGIKK
jgi:release factor glutamine methyltransferase